VLYRPRRRSLCHRRYNSTVQIDYSAGFGKVPFPTDDQTKRSNESIDSIESGIQKLEFPALSLVQCVQPVLICPEVSCTNQSVFSIHKRSLTIC
jgi:hypothetical protein